MKKRAELVFILDRSGSMAGLESDTIGGFNSMLGKQRKALKKHQINVTTVLFDDQYELLHDRIDLESIKPITEEDYYVRGSTALLDAIGKTVSKIANPQKTNGKKSKTNQTLFVIITDGMENASREYNLSQIKAMIETQKAKGWEFIFMGANIDAIKTAQTFGLRQKMASNFVADQGGVNAMYKSVEEACDMMFTRGRIDKDWKSKAEEDFEQRKK